MKNSFLYVLMICIALLNSACNENSTKNHHSDTPVDSGNSDERLSADGLSIVSTSISGAEVYDAIITGLAENKNISILSEVDHSNNAAEMEMSLPYTRVVMFGNPKLGTPLMKENIKAGLDLPQKILVTENEDGTVEVSYNKTDYLRKRFGLSRSTQLDKINSALSSLVLEATGAVSESGVSVSIEEGDGIRVAKSSLNFMETFSSLKSNIERNAQLKVIADINHSANAASVGLDLPNSRLLVFGNAELGTLLMEDSQLIGIDLPMKILVYEDGEDVILAYNDIAFITDRHHIEKDEVESKIEKTLEALVKDNI